MVVFHHLGAPEVAARLTARGHRLLAFSALVGASGVELFFVLSGVVLLRPYLRQGRPFAPATYLYRRVERLLPPYLAAWLVSGLAVYLITRFPSWWSAIAFLPTFHLGDWLAQAGILYFGSVSYNFAWWSLSVEVLFYLLVPLLVPLVVRVPSRIGPCLALLAGAVVFALVLPVWFAGPLAALPKPIAKLLEYSSCFAAGLVMAKVDLPRAAAYVMIALGAVILGGAAALSSQINAHAGYGLVYAGLVCLVLEPQGRLAAAFGRWHLVWFGERSYSLFLVHVAVIVLVYHASSQAIAGRGLSFLIVTRVLAIPLALLAAMVIFSGVERRFARGLVTAEFFWPTRRLPAVRKAAAPGE
jgi:peptidoglycan/LPS O-acetylase OafA/YrhL